MIKCLPDMTFPFHFSRRLSRIRLTMSLVVILMIIVLVVVVAAVAKS